MKSNKQKNRRAHLPLPYLKAPLPLAIAHRGGAAEFPENTMKAFEGAVKMGFRYLETDVRITSDGVLLAFHDSDLKRLAGVEKKISDSTWSELSKVRIEGEKIVRLEDLLKTFKGRRVFINLDPKESDVIKPLAQMIKELEVLDHIGVGSFSGPRLNQMRKLLGKNLCSALNPAQIGFLRLKSFMFAGLFWLKDPAKMSFANREDPLPGFPRDSVSNSPSDSPPREKSIESFPWRGCVQIPRKMHGIRLISPAFIKAAHRRKIQVHVWIVNEPAEIEELLDMGVDGIMTDKPSVLKEVLQRRNCW